MVGLSQLVLTVHWALDVVGGALLGIACTAAAASWNERSVLKRSPFGSVTWMAVRAWVYRWQTVIPIPSFVVLFLTPPALADDSLLDAATDWAGGCFIVAGIVIRVWAAGYAAGQTWPEPLSTRRLITGGPYGYLRNPVPVANGLTGVGIVVLAENALGLMAVPAVLIAISRLTVSLEEGILRQRFGDQYTEYCRDVPRWVPRLRPAPSRQPARFAWDSVRSECPATVNAILLTYVAETSEYLPHIFG